MNENTYTCPRCARISHNPNDVRERYCGACHTFEDGRERIGTPISELSGRPGHPGFEKFCEIARSWGYD